AGVGPRGPRPPESAGRVSDPVPARASATGTQAAPAGQPALVRSLNLWDTTLVVLGLVLGGGIFLTPAAIAQALPAKWAILTVWIGGGLLSVVGGLVYAEMGAMMPRAGGMYLYFR